MEKNSRRTFIKNSAALASGAFVSPLLSTNASGINLLNKAVDVSGHLWQYASAYRPSHDCTPILDQVFSDFKYAGLEGVELMDINLKHTDAVENLSRLIKEYDVPVTGTSFEAAMWDRKQYSQIVENVELVTSRLNQIGGKNFGISVGYKRDKKTEEELDAQADILEKVLKICKKNNILPNLHNHTYEVADNMYDLKGTLARVQDIKLGPDLAHLFRAGIDPVEFINTYGKKIQYLHLRDHKADKSLTEAIGDGVIDFPAIAHALKDVGFNGSAAIELSFLGTPVRPLKENWKLSREYVKRVFGW
jgi:sugar phosphate isomerase/epimerase